MATVVIQKYTGQNITSYAVKYKDPITRKTCHYKTFKRKRDAQDTANALRNMIDSGQRRKITKTKKKIRLHSFNEIADQVLQIWSIRLKNNDIAQSTFDGYSIRIGVLKRLYGKRLICEFAANDIETIRAEFKEKHSPVSSNRYLFVIKQIFKHALEVGAVMEDEAEKVGYLSEKSHMRNRFILPDKINELITASLQTRAKYYLPALICLGAEHGTSKQEALSLQWGDIDFDFNGGLIKFYRTKNGVERTEFIMPRTKQALLDWMSHLNEMRHRKGLRVKNKDVVFCRLNGTPILRFNKAWNRACKIAGLKGFHYHDLRHTFCSNLLLSGSNIKDVKDMIGHRDLSMTERYSHLTNHHRKTRLEKLAEHYKNENRRVGYK